MFYSWVLTKLQTHVENMDSVAADSVEQVLNSIHLTLDINRLDNQITFLFER